MVSEHVVKLAIEYLDQYLETNEPATLVTMLHYIDAHDKTIAVAEEVNEALRRRPSIYVHRTSARLEFNFTGSDQTVTEDDVRRAFDIYHEEFWAAYKKLESRKRSNE